MFDSAKAGEIARVADKVRANPPPGTKGLAQYACFGLAFPGQPPNTTVAVSVIEAETAEAMAAMTYPLTLTGATVWRIPVMEVTPGGAVEAVKKMSG